MSDSIQEQIMKQITTVMQAIPGINSVQRHNALGINLGNMPTILVREGDCAVDLTKSSHQFIRRTLTVGLAIAIGLDETSDPRTGSEALNEYVALVEQAIGANERWTNLALMTSPPEYLALDIDAETPHLSRGLRIDVTYEHTRGNPWA